MMLDDPPVLTQHRVSVMLKYQVTAVLLLLCLSVLSQSEHSHQERGEADQEFIKKNPTESGGEEVKEEGSEGNKTNEEEEKKEEKKEEEERSGPPPYQDLYCGDTNCYDLLEVTRDSDTKQITKAYRRLALKWHPDRYLDKAQKVEAQAMFLRIAAGYEVLKDEESRKDYDYMMDHPEETYGNYYRYYARRLAPQIDIRLVVVSLITVMSLVQYYSAWYNHTETIKYLATVPKYRIQVR